jgi:predicted RNA-binding Zn ribbon-like protein
MHFDSYTDRTMVLAVALVNALTPGMERGRLLPMIARHTARGRTLAEIERPVQPNDLGPLTRLAERLRPVFVAAQAGDADRAAALVNELLDDYRPVPRLVRHDGNPWHLHFGSTRHGVEAELGAALATALAAMVGSEAWRRLGVCSASSCDRVYVDLSRTGSRRYCSSPCQVRARAAGRRATG